MLELLISRLQRHIRAESSVLRLARFAHFCQLIMLEVMRAMFDSRAEARSTAAMIQATRTNKWRTVMKVIRNFVAISNQLSQREESQPLLLPGKTSASDKTHRVSANTHMRANNFPSQSKQLRRVDSMLQSQSNEVRIADSINHWTSVLRSPFSQTKSILQSQHAIKLLGKTRRRRKADKLTQTCTRMTEQIRNKLLKASKLQ